MQDPKSTRSIHVAYDTNDDDDFTQADSQPPLRTKRAAIEDLRNEEIIYSPEIFGQYSQQWDAIPKIPEDPPEVVHCGTQTKDDQVLQSSSSQTVGTPTVGKEEIEAANKAFGAFIAQEIALVPLFKRGYVIYEIIRLIENHKTNMP